MGVRVLNPGGPPSSAMNYWGISLQDHTRATFDANLRIPGCASLISWPRSGPKSYFLFGVHGFWPVFAPFHASRGTDMRRNGVGSQVRAEIHPHPLQWPGLDGLGPSSAHLRGDPVKGAARHPLGHPTTLRGESVREPGATSCHLCT